MGRVVYVIYIRTIFILHGIYGHPEENWFPWLKQELEAQGHTVYVPHLPTHEPLQPEHWWDAFAEYEQYIQPDSIIIGHSLGAPFAFKIIEKHPVAAAFFVAPAWGTIDHELDAVIARVANQDFQWDVIRTHCSQFTVFQADNDPYVPVERAETLAEQLGTTVNLLPECGHFNTASGYTKFPELLECISAIQ